MHSAGIQALIDRLKNEYASGFLLYGSSEQERGGVGFRIGSIPVTFSVLCLSGMQPGQYDFQIESYPPGEYCITGEANLEELLALISSYKAPNTEWPET
jgi:hypothetical protein